MVKGEKSIDRPSEALPKHLAIFIPSLEAGGVARVMLHLAEAFVTYGHRVDLILCQNKGNFIDRVHPTINVVCLNPSPMWTSRFRLLFWKPRLFFALLFPILLSRKPPKTLRYLSDLVRYLRQAQPDVLLSAKTPANLVAIWAQKLAGTGTRVVVSERSTISTVIEKSRKWRWRFLQPLIQEAYPQADMLIAVSNGVAEDVSVIANLPQEQISTIYNPILSEDIKNQSIATISHPWFDKKSIPVILGVGRLVPAKDFSTLLRAFAHIRTKRAAHLLILGEGRERQTLENLAIELGIASDFSLPGFVKNPYPFMSQAAVFVLSSILEGMPNALLEALACGCPVVATDCRSGPREILRNGIIGPLVPVGDEMALAQAIFHSLNDPPDTNQLRAYASEFDLKIIAEQYLKILLSE